MAKKKSQILSAVSATSVGYDAPSNLNYFWSFGVFATLKRHYHYRVKNKVRSDTFYELLDGKSDVYITNQSVTLIIKTDQDDLAYFAECRPFDGTVRWFLQVRLKADQKLSEILGDILDKDQKLSKILDADLKLFADLKLSEILGADQKFFADLKLSDKLGPKADQKLSEILGADQKLSANQKLSDKLGPL